MKAGIFLLSVVCLFAVSETSQAGGHCGGWHGGGGGYCGPAFGWGGGPAWGWGGWGPSFGITFVNPAPVYQAVYVSQPAPGNSGYPRSIVAQTQVRLARLGYYSSDIDGDFGPKTSRAIQHFQVDNGLPATGLPDRRTLSRLGVLS